MNQEKIGKFIKRLRKEKNITQKELANKLNISRQAISQWEVGKAMPDSLTMSKMCNIFNININELLNCEIKEEKNCKFFILYMILFLFVILALITINSYLNYTSTKVYKISFDSTEFSCNNGIIVDETSEVYFSLGTVLNKKNINITGYQLYYFDNNKKVEVFSSEPENNNITIEFVDDKNYKEYLDSENIEKIIYNLYLKIDTENDQIIIPLSIKIYNKKFNFFKKYSINKNKSTNMTTKTTTSKSLISKNIIINNIGKKFKKIDDGYYYEIFEKKSNTTIKFQLVDNIFMVESICSTIREIYELNFYTNFLSYEIYEGKTMKNSKIIDVSENNLIEDEYEKYKNILKKYSII